MNILDEILAHKRTEIAARKRKCPLREMRQRAESQTNNHSLYHKMARDRAFHFICEFKRASPSKGLIRPDADPVTQAESYTRAGASAISVLTDARYFKGSLRDLRDIREVSHLPILRKDFIADVYQIYETRAYGADVLLLIARALSTNQVREFAQLADEIGLDVLLEIATEEDIEKIPDCQRLIIGINNRNLQTFSVDLERSLRLIRAIPADCLVISESGISSPADCVRLRQNGFRGALIGEILMRAENGETLLREMMRRVRHVDAA